MLNPDRDDGVALDRHLVELYVSPAQQALGLRMLRATMQDVGLTMQHHPTKVRPVMIVITVNDEADKTVLGDVAQPLQRLVLPPLRFVIDGHVDAGARQREAHRDNMGYAGGIRRRQMSDAPGFHKSLLFARQQRLG